MKQYDLVVLGSGSAGYNTAIRTAEAGWKVAVIDDYNIWGGTCSNRGCTPKKVLVGAAEVADLNRRFAELGIVSKSVEMDWAKLMQFKRTFTDPTSDSTKDGFQKAGIDMIEGSPRFINDDTLEVNGEQLQAKYFYIATGSQPAKLTLEGAEHLLTSEDFLDLDALPESIIFVGGGYISFELAHVAARFGARVTILHSDDHPLAIFDQDIIKTLLEATKEAGIEVRLNAGAQKIEKNK